MLSVDNAAAAAAAGDRAAAEELLTHLRPLLVRYCRRKIGRQLGVVTAEDIAQEVCLAVFQALPSWRRTASFNEFLYAIAAHKVVDAVRAATRDLSRPAAEIDGVAVADSPEQILLGAERRSRLDALLDVLQPRQRAIVVMRVAMGLSSQETADVVGTTPGAVRVAQSLAITRLRRTAGTGP